MNYIELYFSFGLLFVYTFKDQISIAIENEIENNKVIVSDISNGSNLIFFLSYFLIILIWPIVFIGSINTKR